MNFGTRLHRVSGIDWISYLYTFSQILAVLPKWLDELSSYNYINIVCIKSVNVMMSKCMFILLDKPSIIGWDQCL